MFPQSSHVRAHAYLRLALVLAAVPAAGCGGGERRGSSGAPPPPTSGLVNYWAFDNSFADSTGSANGTPAAGAGFAAGAAGQAVSLNGSDQFVEIPDLVTMSPHATTDRQTISGWFFIDPNAPGNNGDISVLAGTGNGHTVGGGWFLAFDDRGIPNGYPPGYNRPFVNTIWFSAANTNGVYGGDGVIARADNAAPSAGWYHIAATFDPSQTPQSRLYVNGALVADSGTMSIPFISPSGLTARIGAAHINEYGGAAHFENDRFPGLVDEVRYYNRALAASEMATLFNAHATTAGLSPLP